MPRCAPASSARAQRVESRNAELAATEQALAAAEGDARIALCEKLAAIIPDLPERWPREIQLLRELMARGGGDGAMRERLETLIALSRDAIALATFLEDHAEQSAQRQDRMRLLTRLAAVHTVREDTPAVAAVCEALLAIDSRLSHRDRAARARGAAPVRPAAHRACAHAARSDHARAACARPRARTAGARRGTAGLAQRGHAPRRRGAARRSRGSVDGGLILLRNVHRIDPRAALAGLAALRQACGASRALLATQTQAAHASGQRDVQRAAVEAWVSAVAHDAAAHRARLLLCADESDAQTRCSPRPMPRSPRFRASKCSTPRTCALDRLEALGAFEAAAELALRLAEEQGKTDAGWRAAPRCWRGADARPKVLTRALELVVAVRERRERVRALFDLAAHHRARRDFTAEVRTLHRVLELDAAQQ